MSKNQKKVDRKVYFPDNEYSSSAMCRRSKDAVLRGGISYFGSPRIVSEAFVPDVVQLRNTRSKESTLCVVSPKRPNTLLPQAKASILIYLLLFSAIS